MMPQLRSDRRGPAAWLAAPNVVEVKAPTAVAEERAPGYRSASPAVRPSAWHAEGG